MALRRLSADKVQQLRREAVDADTLRQATAIVEEVRTGGEIALRSFAERFGDIGADDPLVINRQGLEAALDTLSPDIRTLLERTAERIAFFANAQRQALTEIEVAVPGGEAGHQVSPVERAGCYAPGGRFPLPSSVLMTAVTARAAGVQEIWVASPRPTPVTLSAAAVAGADAVLTVGGAHAVAALAFGADPVPACDVVVGPGNRWVTAAKKIVAGHVGIDMLAGPSELVVLADSSADPTVIAADLLAQAEHDPDALPVLVSLSVELADKVDDELDRQLEDLPTRDIAVAALANGFTVITDGIDKALEICDRLAPEHLQVLVENPENISKRLRHWGGLFIGESSAEVFGDYGAGPNHTLPTGGVARFKGGLSVFDFLRIRTWLRLEADSSNSELARDSAALARLEGLEAHARAAERRMPVKGGDSEPRR